VILHLSSVFVASCPRPEPFRALGALPKHSVFFGTLIVPFWMMKKSGIRRCHPDAVAAAFVLMYNSSEFECCQKK